jgi:pyruvate kinase
MSEVKPSTDELFEHAVDLALQTGLVSHGDLVAITAGVPLGISGTTNILKVHIVGNVLVKGDGVNGLSASGRLCVGKNNADVLECFNEGEILVMPKTDNSLLKIMRKASAVIVEEAGSTTHAAIVGLTLEIPVICGAKAATDILKTGTTVTVDATQGMVYSGVVKGI